MDEKIIELLNVLCEIVPDGCVLVLKKGRAMLVDQDFTSVKGTRIVFAEMIGQASANEIARLVSLLK